MFKAKILTVTFLFYSFICLSMTMKSSFAVDVAKVNGKAITDRDVQMSISGFNETQKKKILSDSNYRSEMISNLVESELLLQDAEKQGLDKDQTYKDALALFRRNYLNERALQKQVSTKLTESASKAYYEGNTRRYTSDRIKVQHILLNDVKEANEVLALLKTGQDFQTLAEKKSKDPSVKSNRGDLGFITWESPFVDDFKETAFLTKKGEISGPIKTMYGYHLIKVTEKIPGRRMEYPEVELRVKNDLRKELARGYLNDLRKTAKISIDEKALEKLQ